VTHTDLEPDLTGLLAGLHRGERRALARLLSLVENDPVRGEQILTALGPSDQHSMVCAITGPPGAGKSTLVGKLAAEILSRGGTPAVLAVDPSSPLTGGALLGDRIRMETGPVDGPGLYIRSMASRGHPGGVSSALPGAIRILEAYGADPILVETVGVGQSDILGAATADATVLVLSPLSGDEIQAGKAGLLEIADIIVVNKNDLDGASNTVRALEMMKGLRSDDLPQPTVLTTSALSGAGVTGLLDEISSYSGRQARKHKNQRRELVAATIAEELRRAIVSGRVDADGRISDAVEQRGSIAKAVQWLLERVDESDSEIHNKHR